MRVVYGLLLGGVLAVSLARPASAQTSTGSIRGYVTDSGGAPIAGARVSAVNTQTSAVREVTTQSNGFYAILGLVPAEYEVTARQIAMAAQKLKVRVLIGEVFPLDLKLRVSNSGRSGDGRGSHRRGDAHVRDCYQRHATTNRAATHR